MSQNYNRGASNLGYGPNTGSPADSYNVTANNQYSMYGYETKPTQNYVKPNQWNQPNTAQWNQPNSTQWSQPNTIQRSQQSTSQWNQQSTTTQWNQPPSISLTQSKQYKQPQPPVYRETIKYPSLEESQKQKIGFGGLFQQTGGINNLSKQMGNLSIGKQQQEGLSVWANLVKQIDWDALIKSKNVAKEQSDTSWVTYQQQSWLQPQPSKNIQIQTDRKFAFPNPYIKYKIIPGVDEKMALDVTSKDNLQKGLVRGQLIIWDYHGGPNQQFYIHRLPKIQQGFSYQNSGVENDQFILINASTGFVVSAHNLTVKSSKKQNPNQLCVFPKMKDSRIQRWKLKPVSENRDIFIIQSVETGKVLDVEGQSRTNGTNVLQWDQNRQKNQLWKILPA